VERQGAADTLEICGCGEAMTPPPCDCCPGRSDAEIEHLASLVLSGEATHEIEISRVEYMWIARGQRTHRNELSAIHNLQYESPIARALLGKLRIDDLCIIGDRPMILNGYREEKPKFLPRIPQWYDLPAGWNPAWWDAAVKDVAAALRENIEQTEYENCHRPNPAYIVVERPSLPKAMRLPDPPKTVQPSKIRARL
jgi:hypothetical protein